MDLWNMICWGVCLGFLVIFIIIQVVLRIVRKLHPFPMPAFAARILDSPVRRLIYGGPGKVLDRMVMKPGMKVLDLGCGPGYFVEETARRVGPKGRLYCLDIEPKSIARVKDKIKEEGLNNVEAKVADAYSLPLPDESIDLVYLVTVLSEIPDRTRALKELHRVLRPKGRLSITELLPDPDYPLRRTVIRWCKEAGFEMAEWKGNFFSYTLNFRKMKG